jgi:hypothetical protein
LLMPQNDRTGVSEKRDVEQRFTWLLMGMRHDVLSCMRSKLDLLVMTALTPGRL